MLIAFFLYKNYSEVGSSLICDLLQNLHAPWIEPKFGKETIELPKLGSGRVGRGLGFL